MAIITYTIKTTSGETYEATRKARPASNGGAAAWAHILEAPLDYGVNIEAIYEGKPNDRVEPVYETTGHREAREARNEERSRQGAIESTLYQVPVDLDDLKRDMRNHINTVEYQLASLKRSLEGLESLDFIDAKHTQQVTYRATEFIGASHHYSNSHLESITRDLAANGPCCDEPYYALKPGKRYSAAEVTCAHCGHHAESLLD